MKVYEINKQINDLKTKIKEKQIKFMTIAAESKGPLTKDKLFSFGNGGKENGVGYVMRDCFITEISISSKRKGGVVVVGVSVNEKFLVGSEVVLLESTETKKYVSFDSPIFVYAGVLSISLV